MVYGVKVLGARARIFFECICLLEVNGRAGYYSIPEISPPSVRCFDSNRHRFLGLVIGETFEDIIPKKIQLLAESSSGDR